MVGVALRVSPSPKKKVQCDGRNYIYHFFDLLRQFSQISTNRSIASVCSKWARSFLYFQCIQRKCAFSKLTRTGFLFEIYRDPAFPINLTSLICNVTVLFTWVFAGILVPVPDRSYLILLTSPSYFTTRPPVFLTSPDPPCPCNCPWPLARPR